MNSPYWVESLDVSNRDILMVGERRDACEAHYRLQRLRLAGCQLSIGLGRMAQQFHAVRRVGPVAALAFFVFGPLLGVIVFVAGASTEVLRARALGAPERARGTVYGMEVSEYAALMLAIGLSASAAATLVYGGTIEEEFVTRRDEEDDSRPRPVAVPSLHAMGLAPSATHEDVERAYRELELKLRPDRGGDGTAYRRLQRNYELAKRFVEQRQRVMPGRQMDSSR